MNKFKNNRVSPAPLPSVPLVEEDVDARTSERETPDPYRVEALVQAVRFARNITTVPSPSMVVGIAIEFEKYLRGETGSERSSVISDAGGRKHEGAGPD